MPNLKETKSGMGQLEPSATLAVTSKAKAMIAAGEDVCSMSAGEPDFDTPDFIKAAAIEALNQGQTKYTPAVGTPALRQAIADKLIKENGIQTTPAQVLVAPGAKFSCFSAIAALCGPGDEVIIAAPYWVSYPEMIKAAGAKVVSIQGKAENNYEIDPADLAAAITPATKLLVLNTPSNPTGAVYRKESLEKIAQIAIEKDIMVMADEIYEKLTYDADLPHVSIASLSQEICDRTITVNGLSKAYAMTGWRLGYLSAPLWLSKRIAALQSHLTSNPTTFAQAGGLVAVTGDQEPVEMMRQAFSKRRDMIFDLVNAIPGITSIRPSGAFYIFCDITSFGLSSLEFCNRLLDEYKVAAIPGAPFGAEGNIRLSYACSEENIQEAVKRLKEFAATL
jgi:aspartate aminotransferase